MELKDTVELMLSDDHVDRFAAEYHQVKARRDRLSAMLVKLDAGTLGVELACPKALLLQQRRHMDDYLHVLEVRAEIEGVGL